jgi:hypothetical protein
VDDLAGQNIHQGPDWYRLTILFTWYLAGFPTAYTMYDTCAVGAPGTWARGIRVFIEGIVAFGLGGFIYVGIFPFWTGAYGANFECFIRVFFDRDSDVVCSQYTTPVQCYCRIQRKRCHQVQTSSGPVVQQNLFSCSLELLRPRSYRTALTFPFFFFFFFFFSSPLLCHLYSFIYFYS